MSVNATMSISLSIHVTNFALLSEVLAHRIHQVFRYILIPCISVLGIVGNLTSTVILFRKGFKKCSNVLLFALSASDILFLAGVNNIPHHIYSQNIPPSFRFSEIVNYMFYIFNLAFQCAYSIGLQSGLIIPALITGERIFAIFSPLKVYFILTPRRILFVVSCVYILSMASFLYSYIICFSFKQVVLGGFTKGTLYITDMCVNDFISGIHGLIEVVANYMTGLIPITIVTIGCVVLGIQVGLIIHRRKRLISGQGKLGNNTSLSRTTKTLLSICVLYIVCCGFGFLLTEVLENRRIGQDLGLQKVLLCIQDSLLCINCVGDFLIYVGANNSLWPSRNTKRGLRQS